MWRFFPSSSESQHQPNMAIFTFGKFTALDSSFHFRQWGQCHMHSAHAGPVSCFGPGWGRRIRRSESNVYPPRPGYHPCHDPVGTSDVESCVAHTACTRNAHFIFWVTKKCTVRDVPRPDGKSNHRIVFMQMNLTETKWFKWEGNSPVQ